MTKFKVHLTKEIFKEAMYCDEGNVGTNCAIAKAINVLFPNAWVSSHEISFYENVDSIVGFLGEISLPQVAIESIVSFDSSTPLQRLELPEVSFELEMSDEILKKVVDISEIETILKDCKTLELVK